VLVSTSSPVRLSSRSTVGVFVSSP
jgi:hypothetical protein